MNAPNRNLLALAFFLVSAGTLPAFQGQRPEEGIDFDVQEDNDVLLRPNGISILVEDDHSAGAVLADLDGDGFPDLVVPREGLKGGIYIFRNKGDGLATTPWFDPPLEYLGGQGTITLLDGGSPIGVRAQTILAFDYDEDGDLDLLVLSTIRTTTTIQDYIADPNSIKPEPLPASKNYLLQNNSSPGTLSFDIVTQLGSDPTDPDPNAPEDGFGLSYTSNRIPWCRPARAPGRSIRATPLSQRLPCVLLLRISTGMG